MGYYEIEVYVLEHFAEIRPSGYMSNYTVNRRINEINKIRKVIETTLFPYDDPVIAQIVSEFTDGLENLKKI